MPREGHDAANSTTFASSSVFQSTCPARGTTSSDKPPWVPTAHFNPRAPRGARRLIAYLQIIERAFQSTCPARGTTSSFCAILPCLRFQSTCPARGTTLPGKMPYVARIISIHVPREGHDGRPHLYHLRTGIFQSTCPARGTTVVFCRTLEIVQFQSTCPARGTTRKSEIKSETI